MKHPILLDLQACPEAVSFASSYDNLQLAWDACPRGDWLLWFAARRGVKRETLVLAACECARTALPFTKDPRVLVCIETTERWCRGEATLAEVRKAMTDAAAYAYAAAYAAYAAAAYAAYAAYAAAYAADAAADAADADAAAAAAYARKSAQAKCADIVRKHFPTLP